VALGQGAGGTLRTHRGIAVAGVRATAALLALFVVLVAYSLIGDFIELLKSLRRQGFGRKD
jgi:multidrug efflux pump subunit AcrB